MTSPFFGYFRDIYISLRQNNIMVKLPAKNHLLLSAIVVVAIIVIVVFGAGILMQSPAGEFSALKGKCNKANPTVKLTPPWQSGYPGGAKIYTVNVRNNDNGSGCTNTTFAMRSAACPVNWTCVLTLSSLKIAPGKTGTTTFNVVSSPYAAPGNYTPKAMAASGNYSGTGSAVYTVLPPPCSRNNPTVTLNPSVRWGSPGDRRSYAVSVTNNDNGTCSNSTFSMTSPNCPSGWNCSFSIAGLSIPAGGTGSTTLTVTSSPNSAPGNYTVKARATRGTYAGTGSATYIVTSSNNQTNSS